MIALPKIPSDLKFPVSLDLFLRYTAGGKYKADRLKKYRACIAEHEQFHRYMMEGRQKGKKLADSPKPDLVEVSEIIKRHREQGFDKSQFWQCAASFQGWLAAQPAIRASHAAKKRWSQERRHKSNAQKLDASLDIDKSE
jgi:hypothetical protein